MNTNRINNITLIYFPEHEQVFELYQSLDDDEDQDKRIDTDNYAVFKENLYVNYSIPHIAAPHAMMTYIDNYVITFE